MVWTPLDRVSEESRYCVDRHCPDKEPVGWVFTSIERHLHNLPHVDEQLVEVLGELRTKIKSAQGKNSSPIA